jgi:pyrroloquinoline quinone biosynthesis protein B
MGHVPMGGPHGTLAWLRSLAMPRKIYIHINNTNPVLKKNSREQKMAGRAGVEISHDGMDIRL